MTLAYGFIPNHLFTIIGMLQMVLALTFSDHYGFSLLDFHWNFSKFILYLYPCWNLSPCMEYTLAGYLGGLAERCIAIAIFILFTWYQELQLLCMEPLDIRNWRFGYDCAFNAISGILGIGAAAENSKAYYWLILQILFA